MAVAVAVAVAVCLFVYVFTVWQLGAWQTGRKALTQHQIV